MKWAVVMYALLAFQNGNNETREMISWNLPFQSHEMCEAFLKKNTEQLKKGVLTHGKDLYKADMIVKEMGCATATVYSSTPDAMPTLNGRRPHYVGGESV